MKKDHAVAMKCLLILSPCITRSNCRKSNNSTYPKFANDENFSSKSTISCHRRASKSRFSSTSARVNVFVYIKMSTVMGFTWSVGFVSAIMPQVAALRYIFELLVPMQGIFIFFAFICKRRVWNLYKEFKNPHKNKGWKRNIFSIMNDIFKLFGFQIINFRQKKLQIVYGCENPK